MKQKENKYPLSLRGMGIEVTKDFARIDKDLQQRTERGELYMESINERFENTEARMREESRSNFDRLKSAYEEDLKSFDDRFDCAWKRQRKQGVWLSILIVLTALLAGTSITCIMFIHGLLS